MAVEIERKFLINEKPFNIGQYSKHIIEQGYLNISPAIRVRKDDDSYILTYKGEKTGEGIGHIEYNMPLTEEAYYNLIQKSEGNIIKKYRYIIPLNGSAFSKEFLDTHEEIRLAVEKNGIKIELDDFSLSENAPFKELLLAEVEFPGEEAAAAYNPADWFSREVTGDKRFSNAYLSGMKQKIFE